MIYELNLAEKVTRTAYNNLVREVHKLTRLKGANGIRVLQSSAGVTISGTEQSVNTEIRRAITTAAAGASATITANLYDSSGVEQTTGDEAGITVYCTVTGSANLNAAIPLLANDTDIFVTQLPYDSTTNRWYCTQIFQKMDICPLD